MNFEVKKDGLRQMQDGLWKLSLTIMPEDMPMDLLQAPMGTLYNLYITDAEEEEQNAV